MLSKLGILTFYTQYIFSILMFVVKHKDIFTFSTELHKINTHHKLDLHVPSVNLSSKRSLLFRCHIIQGPTSWYQESST